MTSYWAMGASSHALRGRYVPEAPVSTARGAACPGQNSAARIISTVAAKPTTQT